MDKASPQRKKPGRVFLYLWIVQSSYLYGPQPGGPGRANVPPTHWGRDFGQTPLHALPVRHPRDSHLDAYWRQKDKTNKETPHNLQTRPYQSSNLLQTSGTKVGKGRYLAVGASQVAEGLLATVRVKLFR